MDNANFKILIVDDEEDLCEILQFNLEKEGFEVEIALSAEEALEKPLENFSVILLDVMMGKMSGFEFAEKIRKDKLLKTPIIFLTAKNTEDDTLTGFSLGADDYISKPFSIKEVIARVKAVTIRTSANSNDLEEIIKIKGLELNIENKKLIVDNDVVSLTKKEFEILKLFMQNVGRVFSRADILDRIWSDDVIVIDRTIDVNIARIRKKIGKYGKNIINRSGYGYCFEI
ncbi:MAG: response regulator transcription factor [Bacteroidales bacterium]|nr:response regulator transcription factor [Bacteroidales bacterium]